MPWLSLVVSLLLVIIAGAFGGVFTGGAWYAALAKPFLTPPPWLFGPVWTVLYLFMALAAWRIWLRRARDPRARGALWLYAAQLVANAAWSPVFFGLHATLFAFVLLAVLVALVVAALVAFLRIDREAALLLVPYFLWLLLALYLNAGIAWLNPLS